MEQMHGIGAVQARPGRPAAGLPLLRRRERQPVRWFVHLVVRHSIATSLERRVQTSCSRRTVCRQVTRLMDSQEKNILPALKEASLLQALTQRQGHVTWRRRV